VTSEADADVGQATAGLLGLRDAVTAGLFDLGVPTNTAAVHDKAVHDKAVHDKAVHDKAWGEADALRKHGAETVVSDLVELLAAACGKAAW
jgi:hypothetical protein